MAHDFAAVVAALQVEFPNVSSVIADAGRVAELDGTLGLDALNAEQVLDLRATLTARSYFFDHILFLLVDRGGTNYGIWLRGRLAGMWSALDPHEMDLSPLFRSTTSFLAAAAQPGVELVNDVRADFPDVDGRVSADQLAADRETVLAYRTNLDKVELDDEAMTCFFAFSLLALIPRADLDQVVDLLGHPSMFVQERAAVTLGAHKYEPARAKLAALAQGNGNGALAARSALRQLDG